MVNNPMFSIAKICRFVVQIPRRARDKKGGTLAALTLLLRKLQQTMIAAVGSVPGRVGDAVIIEGN